MLLVFFLFNLYICRKRHHLYCPVIHGAFTFESTIRPTFITSTRYTIVWKGSSWQSHLLVDPWTSWLLHTLRTKAPFIGRPWWLCENLEYYVSWMVVIMVMMELTYFLLVFFDRNGKFVASFTVHASPVASFVEPAEQNDSKIRGCVVSIAHDNSLALISVDSMTW